MLETTVIKNVEFPSIPAQAQFEEWSSASYLGSAASSVCITIVNEDESRDMNARYRKQDKPTNVLSFPLELPEFITEAGLGDLIICAPLVEREAGQQGKALLAHWAHMVIHGMLHLQGYDHVTDPQADEMETLEIGILRGLGFENPYNDKKEAQDSLLIRQ